MTIDEKSIYEVTGGDYSIYCFGYTQARTVTNDIMKADPWGGIPFVIRKDLEVSLDDRGNVVMSRNTLDKILFLASDELPEEEG
tara:strand:+ start:400 stop:651 length:252 start_codon:yes stop_codon:yes gene_type:complete